MSFENDINPLVLYFHVHQPRRLKRLGFLDIGYGSEHFDDDLNDSIMRDAASRCYLPVNSMLTRLCKELKNVRVTFSISGIALKQFDMFAPDVLESFRTLINTGCVEILAETSHHSLTGLVSGDEFASQVREHSDLVEHYFNVKPVVFRNTELIYNNDIGARVAELGYNGIVCDDVSRVVRTKAKHAHYHHPDYKDLKILLRNNTLSDDISFRFLSMDVQRYIDRIENTNGVVTLAMDYETFGEHQSEGTGVINFLRELVTTASNSHRVALMTPSDVFENHPVKGKLDVPESISWADEAKDLSAWLENDMQNEAFLIAHSLEDQVKQTNDPELIEHWRQLLTSDHFYYMSTKTGPDGEVHSSFSPYPSPHEAYINCMNVVNDFRLKVKQATPQEVIEA